MSPASKRAAKSAASDASYARLCSSRQRRTTADVSPPQKPARRRRSASSGTVHVTTRSFQVPSKNSARGTGSTSSNVRGGSGAACESEASESAEDADGDASGAESARGWRMATGASGGGFARERRDTKSTIKTALVNTRPRVSQRPSHRHARRRRGRRVRRWNPPSDRGPSARGDARREARGGARAREGARGGSVGVREAREGNGRGPRDAPDPRAPVARARRVRERRAMVDVRRRVRARNLRGRPVALHLHLEHRPEDARPDRATRRAASTQDRCDRDDDDEVVVRRARQARVARRRHARLRARARASRRRRRRRATAKTSRARAGRGVPPVAPAETRAFVESAAPASSPRTFAKPPLAKRRREHRPRGSSNPTARVRRRHRRGPTSGDVASRADRRGVREARVGGGGDGSAENNRRGEMRDVRRSERVRRRGRDAAVSERRRAARARTNWRRRSAKDGDENGDAGGEDARAVRAMRTRVVRARRGSNRRRARRTRNTSPLVTLTCPASLSIAQVLRRGVRGGGLGDAPTRVRGDVARVRAPGTRRGDESTRRTRRFGRQSAIHDHEHRARVVSAPVVGDGGDGRPASRRVHRARARRSVLF